MQIMSLPRCHFPSTCRASLLSLSVYSYLPNAIDEGGDDGQWSSLGSDDSDAAENLVADTKASRDSAALLSRGGGEARSLRRTSLARFGDDTGAQAQRGQNGDLTEDFASLPNDFRDMKISQNVLGAVDNFTDAQDLQVFLNLASGPAGFAAWTTPYEVQSNLSFQDYLLLKEMDLKASQATLELSKLDSRLYRLLMISGYPETCEVNAEWHLQSEGALLGDSRRMDSMRIMKDHTLNLLECKLERERAALKHALVGQQKIRSKIMHVSVCYRARQQKRGKRHVRADLSRAGQAWGRVDRVFACYRLALLCSAL